MLMPSPAPRPEQVTKAGEVLVSANHIALLHGLCDRPNGEAESTADLVRAALPYIAFFRHLPSTWTLRAATHTLHPAWATCQRVGGRIAWRISNRGREIVERKVPARIRGVGPYLGLAQLREKTKPERQRKALDARWAAAGKDPILAPLVASADKLIQAWCARNAPRCFNDALRYEHIKKELVRHVRSHVLWRGDLPVGTQDVSTGRATAQFPVDFDELRRVVAAAISVEHHGSVLLVRPLTREAEARLHSLVDRDAQWWRGALVCEPRYLASILSALRREEE